MPLPPHVQKGQAIRADHQNQIIDEIRQRYPFEDLKRPPWAPPVYPGNMLLILNSSGSDRDIGEILVADSVETQTTAVHEAVEDFIIDCIDPVWHTNINAPLVLAEPIPDGETGWAVCNGPALIKCSYQTSNSEETFLQIKHDSVNEVTDGSSGFAKLLAKFGSTYAWGNVGERQDMWMYKLTENSLAPNSTTATLYDLEKDNTYGTVEIEDVESFMDDQVTDDFGNCYQAGNKFRAEQAKCS